MKLQCQKSDECCDSLICNPWALLCTKRPPNLPPGQDCTPPGAIVRKIKNNIFFIQ